LSGKFQPVRFGYFAFLSGYVCRPATRLAKELFQGHRFIFGKYSPSLSKVCLPPSIAPNSLTT
jgi:hypothetical protein